MVRLVRRGDAWVEVPPEGCPAGHPGQLLPRWHACTVCRSGCRHWLCSAEACGWLVRDEDHPCHGQDRTNVSRRPAAE